MLNDNLLFIKAVLRFVTASLNLIYRGAKVVQYAFVAWLVYRLFRNLDSDVPVEDSGVDTMRVHSRPSARRTTAPMGS